MEDKQEATTVSVPPVQTQTNIVDSTEQPITTNTAVNEKTPTYATPEVPSETSPTIATTAIETETPTPIEQDSSINSTITATTPIETEIQQESTTNEAVDTNMADSAPQGYLLSPLSALLFSPKTFFYRCIYYSYGG